MFLDLNGFKQLNDTYGHDAGDLILIETADRIQKTVRSNDLVFRLGGDEFIIIIKDIRAKADAKIVANNILQGFAIQMMIQGNALEVSLSMGIALSPDDSRISKEIIKFADLAMYKAKRDKQASYQFFEPSLQTAMPNKRPIK
ncbi:MAG: GGDEF domain-containing protein [Psychromonas sp.]